MVFITSKKRKKENFYSSVTYTVKIQRNRKIFASFIFDDHRGERKQLYEKRSGKMMLLKANVFLK
jgi:hypothetical protein